MAVHLVGDIGATNARFALLDASGVLSHGADLLCASHAGIAAAIRSYLDAVGVSTPRCAVLAVATTPCGDHVTFTNNDWSFSISELARRLGVDGLRVINDFEANARALPILTSADVSKVGRGEEVRGAPMGVIGPGSGLGVAAAVAVAGKYQPLAGEGGHVTMAPADDRESAVLAVLQRHFEHVSAERVLSGPGLVNLYQALAAHDGDRAEALSAEQITRAAIDHADPRAAEAVAMFCAMLGTVAGNLALTLGARGGVYIAGGIVPKLGALFARSPFRARFEDKGRFRGYLAQIPTLVITHRHAALLGAAQLLAEERCS